MLCHPSPRQTNVFADRDGDTVSKSHKKHDHHGEKCAIIDSVSELDCRARGSPLPRLEWLVRERPVLSSYLVDTIMANRDFVEKRVMVRGASKMHEVSALQAYHERTKFYFVTVNLDKF